VKWSERIRKAAKIGGGSSVADIQIVGHSGTAMEGRRRTTDDNEVNLRIA
jgi:hypothetical protein